MRSYRRIHENGRFEFPQTLHCYLVFCCDSSAGSRCPSASAGDSRAGAIRLGFPSTPVNGAEAGSAAKVALLSKQSGSSGCRAQAARAKPAQFPELSSSPGDLVLLVATDKAGLPIWAVTSTVGMITEECNGRTLDGIATTITIPVTLSDATAFDLDDNVGGFVVPCGDRRILTTRKGFQHFLEPTVSELLRACCGLEVTPSPARPGVAIVNIDGESLLAKTGGRTGDRIVQLNGSPVSTEQDLQVLTTGTPVEILVERGKRNRRVKFTLPGSDSGEKGSAE